MSDIAVESHRQSSHCGDELLSEFVDRLFAHLPRADQRSRSHEYVTGLLVTPGKKSLRRMAAAVSDSPHTSQALQQFVNVSPWDWRPVRHTLADWVERRRTTLTWSLGLCVIPKRGERSAGVHRRYATGTDRTVNCQLGIGLFLGSADVCVPVDWRLVLPGQWQTDEAWREAARITTDEAASTEGACALDLVRTQWRAAGRRAAPLVADLTEMPHDPSLLPGLAALGTGFVVRVTGDTAVYPSGGQYGPVAVSRLLRGTTPGPGSGVVLGPGGRGRSQVRTCGVRLTHGAAEARRSPCGVIAEHPAGEQHAPRYFVTDLTHHRPGDVLALANTMHRTRATVRELQEHGGLLDFEGRSYPGWHHHMTLVAAAYAFSRLGAQTPVHETPRLVGPLTRPHRARVPAGTPPRPLRRPEMIPV
ncbi:MULTISPECIES: transposase [unclassified Streptomyces]|uniref:IS701 family transposase n=1 Tax=unclassified Streptomyces TaxID=2593676 RepID=UPI002E17118F|nr:MULTISPECIES: transposase [unclassified Streptomyces]